jgi:hypothetical protein
MPDRDARSYRDWEGCWTRRFRAAIGESDIEVRCDVLAEPGIRAALAAARLSVELEILADGRFGSSLRPVPSLTGASVPSAMAAAGLGRGVGPMAAVAGAVADAVGAAVLRAGARSVIVENGGDVFARVQGPLRFAVYPGEASPLPGSPVLEVDASGGVGICTSSGTVGHSTSLGAADAVTVVARSAAAADAAATALANRVADERCIEEVLGGAELDDGLLGIFACAGASAGFRGRIALVGFAGGRV